MMYDTDKPNGTNKSAQATARYDYDTALTLGFWRSLVSWFTRSSNELLPYDEVRKRLKLHGQHYLGMREIPLDKIIGSVGRYNDFDKEFLPRRSATRSRWVSIDAAQLQDVILPPIEVYKIGEVYFVKDGNHRVSVARRRKQGFIDAEVIEIEVAVPVNADTNIDDLIRLQEKADFFEKTHLLDLRPDANLELSLPIGYSLLLDHIGVHRWYMGEKSKKAVPYQEAVTDWYDTVYYPLIFIIRQHNILEKFSGRTEADLYVWIIEHLWYLREECNEQNPSLEDAVTDFTLKFSHRPPQKAPGLTDKIKDFFSSLFK
jgi:hypothetical protein